MLILLYDWACIFFWLVLLTYTWMQQLPSKPSTFKNTAFNIEVLAIYLFENQYSSLLLTQAPLQLLQSLQNRERFSMFSSANRKGSRAFLRDKTRCRSHYPTKQKQFFIAVMYSVCSLYFFVDWSCLCLCFAGIFYFRSKFFGFFFVIRAHH